ncbi:MAG: F0F1 ATP synthase subunit B [Christensenellales bacterium]|nr:F0F1 ATP synthase subunit B [Christensenellales bacterium]
MGQFESFIGVNFWTALFVLLNTLTIFFVARKYLFGPVHKIITDRQEEIDGMYADAKKAKSDAQAMAEEYQQKLADAQATSERLVREAAVRGQNRAEEIVRQAGEEASAILNKASVDAALEKKKAVNDAKNEISAMALAVAEKVIDRELTDADRSRLVDHFIDELGDNA